MENPKFARLYPLAANRADARGAAEHRTRLLAGLAGRVVEIGAGDGRNFARYPGAVTEVVAIEPEPTLRAAASKAASAVPVTVLDGLADALPLEDESVDAAVVSLVLCSVPDQPAALAEIKRVLRPGGELRFYEHVIPLRQPKRVLAQLLDRTGVWPKLAGGCHLTRDTQAAIEAAGLEIARSERIDFRGGRLEPTIPHVLGMALKG